MKHYSFEKTFEIKIKVVELNISAMNPVLGVLDFGYRKLIDHRSRPYNFSFSILTITIKSNKNSSKVCRYGDGVSNAIKKKHINSKIYYSHTHFICGVLVIIRFTEMLRNNFLKRNLNFESTFMNVRITLKCLISKVYFKETQLQYGQHLRFLWSFRIKQNKQ